MCIIQFEGNFALWPFIIYGLSFYSQNKILHNHTRYTRTGMRCVCILYAVFMVYVLLPCRSYCYTRRYTLDVDTYFIIKWSFFLLNVHGDAEHRVRVCTGWFVKNNCMHRIQR